MQGIQSSQTDSDGSSPEKHNAEKQAGELIFLLHPWFIASPHKRPFGAFSESTFYKLEYDK
jgi:hypothetical protein